MKILRPQELRLIACGLPSTPANRSSSDSSQSSTSNNYSDKRNAVQNGIGVSGDGNSTSYSSYNVTTDGGAVNSAMNAAMSAFGDAGAVAVNAIGTAGAVANQAMGINGAVAVNANQSMAQVSGDVLSASQHLADVGLSMLQSNTALTNSLTGAAMNSAAQTTQIAADLAKTQVAAQNDNRYLIAAGLAVVCIVGVIAMKGKA